MGAVGTADYNNSHWYPHNGNQPQFNAAGGLATVFAQSNIPGMGPMQVTESGYCNLVATGSPCLDTNSQAVLSLNETLDALAYSGYASIYHYNLIEDGLGHGVYNTTTGPLPVGNAFHNFTSILHDYGKRTAATFARRRCRLILSPGLPAADIPSNNMGGFQAIYREKQRQLLCYFMERATDLEFLERKRRSRRRQRSVTVELRVNGARHQMSMIRYCAYGRRARYRRPPAPRASLSAWLPIRKSLRLCRQRPA